MACSRYSDASTLQCADYSVDSTYPQPGMPYQRDQHLHHPSFDHHLALFDRQYPDSYGHTLAFSRPSFERSFNNGMHTTYQSPTPESQPPYFTPSPSLSYERCSSRHSGSSSPSLGSSASFLPVTPELHDLAVPALTASSCDPPFGAYGEVSCVSMQFVQAYPDTPQFEGLGDDFDLPDTQPQEMVPMAEDTWPSQPAPAQQAISIVREDDDNGHTSDEIEVVPRRRGPKHRHIRPHPAAKPTKIEKRHPSRGHRQPTSPVPLSPAPPSSPRAFPCPLAPYGCPSAFKAKNEWKRHAFTQHFRLKFWRCDQCSRADPAKAPNDFNRKDLFVQHVRRMHPVAAPVAQARSRRKRSGRAQTLALAREPGVQAALNEAAERCAVGEGAPPSGCACLFCEERFEGEGCLGEYMEHVGRHMDERKKLGMEAVALAEWKGDGEMERWLLEQGLVVEGEGALVLP